MVANSKIEWTHHTFNPWRGCSKVSEGCTHCYADTLSKRNPGTLGIWGPNGTRVVASESMWCEPVKWDRVAANAGERHRVFCASLADVFEDWSGPVRNSSGDELWYAPVEPDRVVPWRDPSTMTETEKKNLEEGRFVKLTLDAVRSRLFRMIDATPNLDWLLLTKRPENIARMTPAWEWNACVTGDCPHDLRSQCDNYTGWRPNVWLGTSVENQGAADKRIPELLKIPSDIRFLSMEPLLGPVDLSEWIVDGVPGQCFDINGDRWHERGKCPSCTSPIHWVIVGGESQAHCRPMEIDWAWTIMQQCFNAGIPFFMKQLGGHPNKRDKLEDFPVGLRIREFPRTDLVPHRSCGP